MTGLDALWLPILLSTVFVFVASSIIHMAPLWHKGDYLAVPEEEKFRELVRPLAIPPGDYLVPRPSSGKEMRTPEFAQKINEGPNMIITVIPNGPPSMARNLVGWFLYCAVVGVCAAYITGRALPAGAPCRSVFRFAGATAFIGYSVALWQMSIWYRRAWIATLKANLDGLIYALITAATFGWLWPK